MRFKLRVFVVLAVFLASFSSAVLLAARAAAQASPAPNDFSLQVTPSPLFAEVKPGIPVTLELKIRNAGSAPEELKIEPRGFDFNSNSGDITIDDTSKAAIADWVKFSAPIYTIAPGQWYTQKVTISVPKEAGFSYPFVLIISRKNNPQPVAAGRLIKGSVAVFTLVNIDKPGATRKLEIPTFETDQQLYEFLPATLKVRFKNTGNSIVQPYGNIFIQRGSDDDSPLTTLKVNDNKAYILPGTARTISVDWQAGFPVQESRAAADGTTLQRLAWNWDNASDFRIGKYTAKLVAVYNDGQRDVPIQQEITFWVVPWRGILVILASFIGLLVFSRWRNKRRTEKAVKRALAAHQAAQDATKSDNPKPGS